MPELDIRDARAGDQQAILELVMAAYQEYAAVIPEHWPDYRQNIVETISSPEPGVLIVAELDGALLGSVLLYHAGAVRVRDNGERFTMREPEFRLLAVDPAARGQGVGAALVDECIRRAREAGSPTLTLHTTNYMPIAKAMYERMGFVRDPELDFHPDEAILVMGYRLELAGQPSTSSTRSA
jgi:GNAT superfamily N-acetyltransferase